MQTSRGISIGIIAAVAAAFLSAPLWQSAEGQATQLAAPDAAAQTIAYPSATQAYREGATALEAGKIDEALSRLRYAADRGVLGAQIRLARHYAESDPADSFRYFSLIADQHADILPSSPIAHYVAEAFVALADTRRSGIPGHVEQDSRRAAGLYFHAASFFGSAEAQYKLAMMHMAGEGMSRNMDVAVKWLANAAKKRHPMSQALLGQILWRGETLEAQPARGLALMMSAYETAEDGASADAALIAHMLDQARNVADDVTKREAQAIVSVWRMQPRIDLGIDVPDTDVAAQQHMPAGAADVVVPASIMPAGAVLTR